MANPTDVLFQLQAKMNTNYLAKTVEVRSKDDLEEDLEEDIGGNSTSAGTGFGSSMSNRFSRDGGDVDADDADAVDTPYVTNRAITINDPDSDKRRSYKTKMDEIFTQLEQAAAAAPEEGMSPDDPGADAPGHTDYDGSTATEGPPECGEEMPPPEGGESMPGGMDAMGGGMEEEKKTPSELGRIYELKKIYTRLTTIESYLSESSDPNLLRMRLLVSKSIELFEILASNIPSYRPPKAPPERIDEIIVMYYKFLKQVYESVAVYFKKRKDTFSSNGLQKATIKLSDKELV